MSSPFPLLRLPRLVLFDVFKLLSIGEKIKLSLCSKKISTQINNCRLYSQKVMVSLDMLYQGIRVYSENNNDRFGIFNRYNSATINNPDMQQYQIEGRTVLVISFPRRIETFWKNHQEGFLSVIQHLLKMFQCKISTSYKNEFIIEYLYVKTQNYTNDGAMILGMNLMELRGQVIQTDNGSKKATFRTDSRSIEMSVTSFV
ncbi:hypothetical protein CRE_22032 [Caenorhabditis remanei]|uniref:F-box domain-containing protein n=1 Tax=Caenorhabditis remanei TaxID=31234 RepID=E3N3G9_CAERE|nr:hypothetical protein CRE_22032 [Caenorhabditis remanei]